jgi:acyl-CoA reductase-like NAD-dependent aldehyde dehydrogenase
MAVVEQLEVSAEGRRRLRLASPATLAPIGEIEVQNPADVKAALERARKAQPGWAEISYEERGSYLQRAVRVMLERQDEFVEVLCAETGKPRIEALGGELMTACDALQYYAKRAKRILGDRQIPLHLLRTKKLRVRYKPLGVVGIITPWNYPFVLSLNPTVQALIAGNAVLLKPSEVTPFSGRLVAELLEAAGLPEGVFQLVLGDGETGAALVEAGLDKISFTGSVRTGRVVAEACARSLVPCTLELGGKDPMIVCADADLDRAARGAVFGAFTNSGQVCMSTERVYVVEEVAEAFTEKCLDHTAKLRQGAEGEFDVGSISWPHQLDIIEEHVRDAVEKGARVLSGGRRNPDYEGYFFEPTILVDVSHEADEAEAVALANDSRYGLNASVWTRNKHKGAEIARMLESGCVVVNDCMVNYAATESPFGGVKDSGIGRVNGELGLKSYCHVQSVLTDRLGSRSEPLWYPYSERKLRRIQRTMRFLWGTSVGRFLS